jgi:hypothetical protein
MIATQESQPFQSHRIPVLDEKQVEILCVDFVRSDGV